MSSQKYLEVTQQAGRDFFGQKIAGPVVMLNLLRFREIADYSSTPALAPPSPISGEEAYRRYVRHTLPHFEASGATVLFFGSAGAFLIGPDDERWDAVMLVRHASAESFRAFASNRDYVSGMGHRLAALEDSRLLPIVEGDVSDFSGERR